MIPKDVEIIKEEIKKIFNNTSDLVIHEFITLCGDIALIAYLDGLVDKYNLNDNLIRPLIRDLVSPQEVVSTVFLPDNMVLFNINEIEQPMTNGHVVLFIENMEIGYAFEIIKWETRSLEEPQSERVLRGPREGFIEDIQINKTLIRRKVRNCNLVFEDYILGAKTNTNVSLVYIKGIVKEEMLEEVRSRVKAIDIDGILDSGYIEHLISDSPNSLVSTVSYTEKANVVVGGMLEGKVAIICDGSPDVLIVPKLFIETLQMPDDYYSKHRYSTYLRIMRMFSLLVAILLPGLFVALKTFHQEMIPTELLITMSTNIEGIPFNPLVEGLLMLVFLEIVKESGLRIPNNIGNAVTVVGGLILGQTAVEAGIVSPIMVIVIAITAVAEFIIPEQKEVIVIYRLCIIILGGVLGLFGVACGIGLIIGQLVSIKSFGVPYMYPIAPYDKEAIRDFIIMRPLDQMNYRPKVLSNNRRRGNSGERK